MADVTMRPLEVTPTTVKLMAAQLGIQQPWMLGVARTLLEMPLPTGYKLCISSTDGSLAFVNRRTGQSSPEHPQLAVLLPFVQQLAGSPHEGSEQQTCMVFTRKDGTSYAWDFATSTELELPAPGATPVEDGEEHDDEPSGTADGAEGKTSSTAEAGSAEAATPAAPAEVAAEAGTKPDEAKPGSTTEAGAEAAPSSSTPAGGTGEPAAAGTAGSTAGSTGGEKGSAPSWTRMIVPLPLSELPPGLRPPPLGSDESVYQLRFYSWWYEDNESNDLTLRVDSNSNAGGGLRRRYVTLDYDLQACSFTVRTDNDDQELVLSGLLGVTTKAGVTAEVWDLHVGAVLKVLGRTMELHKAEIATALWIDRHAKRLKELRAELLAELQKYRPRAHRARVTDDRGHRSQTGALCLRFTVQQCQELLEELATYRPSRAEALRARIKLQI